MKTSERLARLEERVEHIIVKIDDIRNNHLSTIYKKLERPSWLITIIIAFLSSLSVGLITKLVTK